MCSATGATCIKLKMERQSGLGIKNRQIVLGTMKIDSYHTCIPSSNPKRLQATSVRYAIGS